MELESRLAFAVWITGLPGSGKSTLAAALARKLGSVGVKVAVLESDSLRKILTPHPTYSDEERDQFYSALAFIGALLVDQGVPVIFDATANRRAYRDRARERIPRFLEVYVSCPLEVCLSRDPKGIYQKGLQGSSGTVPGLQTPYEVPEKPDLVVSGVNDSPEDSAGRILQLLLERRFLVNREASPSSESAHQ